MRALSRTATSENERELAAIAVGVPAGALPRAIAAWLHRTSNDAKLERHQHEQRSVTWRNEPDGLVTFTARLPPLSAGVLISHLTTRVMRSRPTECSIKQWPTRAQQHADALAHLLREGAGAVTTELIVHVRDDGAALDDGTALPMTVVERIAPEAFIRALIHDSDNRPINASAKRRRHPSTRQKRVVKECDRASVDAEPPPCWSMATSPTSLRRAAPSSKSSNSAAPRVTGAATGRRPRRDKKAQEGHAQSVTMLSFGIDEGSVSNPALG